MAPIPDIQKATMKQLIINHAKNLLGWKTKRKLIAISVDDYGNVRVHSKEAREAMNKAGLKIHTRFDAYDALDNKQDLEQLFSTLSSVKDINGNAAVFTPFALPCNIDFEAIKANGYTEYQYELLTETYEKMSALDPQSFEGAWKLYQEGMDAGLLVPQFHGREHLNLKVFREKLAAKNPELQIALDNRSYTSISSSGYPTISYTAAFEYWKFEENEDFKQIIREGLDAFEKVYGYRSTHFNPPGGREHPVIHSTLQEEGITFLDTPFIKQEHIGEGKYRKVLNWSGKKNDLGMTYQVRNVVFEPIDDRGFDWVNYSLKQIEAAFSWGKPAIISSHRVNYAGHIDPRNREKGLSALQSLLTQIQKKWPDVEFVSTQKLNEIMTQS